MKKIIIGLAIVALIAMCAMIAMEHVVVIKTYYTAKTDMFLIAIGPTKIHFERVETKFLSGEILDTKSGDFETDDAAIASISLNGREWVSTEYAWH